MQDKNNEISILLKMARKKTGKCQQKTAEALNLTQSQYSKIEKNPCKMPVEILLFLVQLLDIDKQDLFKLLFA